jgi:hypothetical protein
MMDRKQPDLIRNSKLKSIVNADHAVRVRYVSNPVIGQRRMRVEERWETSKKIEESSFGQVLLQKCTPNAYPALKVKGIYTNRRFVGKRSATIGFIAVSAMPPILMCPHCFHRGIHCRENYHCLKECHRSKLWEEEKCYSFVKETGRELQLIFHPLHNGLALSAPPRCDFV